MIGLRRDQIYRRQLDDGECYLEYWHANRHLPGSALFYKATIQTIILFGSETWMINEEILRMLTSFHHGVA
jgi:hypothetical protein